MSSISWSTDALNVIHRFVDAELVVYVEGDDDISIWHSLLTICGLKNISVRPCGGCEAVERMIDKIINEEARVAVCRDSDYCGLLGRARSHPRVIYTYGHSIENTIATDLAIRQAANTYARKIDTDLQPIKTWREKLAVSLERLLVLEVANETLSRGKRVLGDNCAALLSTNTSSAMCETKIAERVAQLEDHFSEQEIRDAAALIEQDRRARFWLIRGKFITNSVINCIKEMVTATGRATFTMSHENYFALMCAYIKREFLDPADIGHLDASVHRLIQALPSAN